jgi:hypothetical protein
MTLHHLSIILGVAGTFLVAFSIKSVDQYGNDFKKEKKRWKKEDFFSPSQVTVRKGLLRTGLALITLAAILQW